MQKYLKLPSHVLKQLHCSPAPLILPFCCRPLSNTGQGRRRLNARAALRAGQDKLQTGPVATSPHPHPQPTPMSTLAARQPSLDMTESGTRRKSKAMAGAYSSTYSKMQAQGHLLQPSMQLSFAEAATSDNQQLLPSGKLRQPSCVCTPCPRHLGSLRHCMPFQLSVALYFLMSVFPGCNVNSQHALYSFYVENQGAEPVIK